MRTTSCLQWYDLVDLPQGLRGLGLPRTGPDTIVSDIASEPRTLDLSLTILSLDWEFGLVFYWPTWSYIHSLKPEMSGYG